LLIVIERSLFSRQAGCTELGSITGDLDLADKVKHVRCQTRIKKNIHLKLAGLGRLLGLIEDKGKIVKHFSKLRDGDLKKHGSSFLNNMKTFSFFLGIAVIDGDFFTYGDIA